MFDARLDLGAFCLYGVFTCVVVRSRLFASRQIDLKSYDASVVARAAEFYDEPRLQRQMAFDRETYAAAVRRA